MVASGKRFGWFHWLALALDSAVPLSPLRYKYLEIVRNRELSQNKGIYNAVINLDSHAIKYDTMVY